MQTRGQWRVTAASRTGAAGHAAAEAVAARLRLAQFRRGNQSLAKMSARHGPGGWLIVHPTEGLHAKTPDGTLWRWHPGLARVRVGSRAAGHPDPLLDALACKPGMRVLDANLGQGHDAIVAADAGAVVTGLEIDPIVHAITTDGLARCALPELRAAALRIETICADQAEFLACAPTNSFDAVVLSPMYQAPEFRAEDLVQLRQVAASGWPTDETLAHALRVAPRVIVKVEPHRHPPLPPVARWLGGRRNVAWALLQQRASGA
ncbi:MAG: class I SAM-dependent methyltransferase [Myxococcales bacterium]|nr:class I SAM-dependent methyltransferase [Myxococcales bacterium]